MPFIYVHSVYSHNMRACVLYYMYSAINIKMQNASVRDRRFSGHVSQYYILPARNSSKRHNLFIYMHTHKKDITGLVLFYSYKVKRIMRCDNPIMPVFPHTKSTARFIVLITPNDPCTIFFYYCHYNNAFNSFDVCMYGQAASNYRFPPRFPLYTLVDTLVAHAQTLNSAADRTRSA